MTSLVRDLGLASASAFLLVLAFPKLDLSPLAWIGLVPLLLALEGRAPKRGFLLAHTTGIVFFNGIFYWISVIPAWNMLDHLVVGGLYLPLYVSLWGAALNWIRSRTRLPATMVAPPLWVAAEYLRAHAGFLSLPWMFLSHSQYLHPSLLQVAGLTGAYGLSFLIVLVNAALADAVAQLRPRSVTPLRPAWRGTPVVSLGLAALLVAATWLYGRAVLGEADGTKRIKVAVIQGNIPQDRKWHASYRETILDRHARLTRQAARAGPSLIIWPETAVPGDVEHRVELRKKVAQLATEVGSYLLVGSAEAAKFTNPKLRGKYYNSLALFSPRGTIEGVYAKRMLVPFGEYVPLRDLITWPKVLVAEVASLLSGTENTAFNVGGVTFRTLICWEIIFPDLVRESVNAGAQFLVLATNEAWFGDSAAPYQLLAMTAVRAAETRVAIARAANTGVSAVIDPFGRITHRLVGPGQRDLFVEGVLTGDIALTPVPSFYARYGDLFAFLQLALSGVLLMTAAGTAAVRRRVADIRRPVTTHALVGPRDAPPPRNETRDASTA